MKRAEQLARTRKEILRTATKLFLEQGYNATSTRDIAKHIGITQPALYHHFSDKEVLYLDVLTTLCGKVRQDINKVMRKDDLTPADRLQKIAQVLLKYHPLSIYSQYQNARRSLSASSQLKLDMIFMMDYIEPISEFFELPEVDLRPDILPKEAAELFLADLTPLFSSLQQLGGRAIRDDQRQKIILDCILNGFIERA